MMYHLIVAVYSVIQEGERVLTQDLAAHEAVLKPAAVRATLWKAALILL